MPLLRLQTKQVIIIKLTGLVSTSCWLYASVDLDSVMAGKVTYAVDELNEMERVFTFQF